MEKKFIISRVDLGQRVTGYEVFAPDSNGGEVYGYTPKMIMDGVKSRGAMGMVLSEDGELVLDAARGYKAIHVLKNLWREQNGPVAEGEGTGPLPYFYRFQLVAGWYGIERNGRMGDLEGRKIRRSGTGCAGLTA